MGLPRKFYGQPLLELCGFRLYTATAHAAVAESARAVSADEALSRETVQSVDVANKSKKHHKPHDDIDELYDPNNI